MKRLGRHSLSLQLPLVASGAALLLGLCLLWLAATASSHLQREQEQRYGSALARQLAVNLREPLRSGDLLAARANLERFIDSSMASGIVIRDVEGAAIGSAGVGLRDVEAGYRAAITVSGDIAGEVQLSVDRTAGKESRWRFLFSLLALTIALSLAVFIGTRYLALRMSTRIAALHSQLLLPSTEGSAESENEIDRLEHSVGLLPLDMLRGHAPVPRAATEFQDSVLLYVHLASLARYVDTLSESNLHRYTRRLQQLVQAAAHCYRGDLTVARPFGLLISFGPQPNAGSEALRASCCARLIAELSLGLRERTSLSIDLALALGRCEEESGEVDDIYPALHQQGVIDELCTACLSSESYPRVLMEEALGDDEQQREGIQFAARPTPADAGSFRELLRLADEQESLLSHQAGLIVERIAPRREGGS
ncbi:MAG: hypothetical protein AAGI72_01025 [Pseudomonadota bacterium]